LQVKLGDWIGVHPLFVLTQLGYLALFYGIFADHLFGPGPIEPATIVLIAARNVLMFTAYYGALFAVFHGVPATSRRLWRFKINPTPPKIGAEIRRSVTSWLVAAGYETAIYCGVRTGTIVIQEETSVLTAVLLLAWADLHFFATHRLLHLKWLYRRVHYVHHLSTNTNVWSTFSFHPVEALVYFSAMLIVFAVPVSVFHVVLLKIAIDYTGAYGHLGFASRFGGSRFHHLHHKRHDVNYGASVVWDRLFGSFR
jgi:sterol desaturase/sphingolipid hydroxylase (fatty acid hydroxylase superfamily)